MASKAILQTFDGATEVVFTIPPAETQETYRAEWVTLSVLNSGQPLVKYNSSNSTYKLPKLDLLNQGNKTDISGTLKQLQEWTRPAKDQGLPKLLKFNWGVFNYPRVYLQQADVAITRRKPDGTPVQATVNLTLLEAPEVPKVLLGNTGLSTREQTEQTKAVQEKVKEDKNNIAWKTIKNAKDIQGLSVDKSGDVIFTAANKKPVKVGTLRAVLGKVPPGLGGIVK